MIIKARKQRAREPITDRNLLSYIKENYPSFSTEKRERKQIKDFQFCRQAEFEKGLNCSLTSISALIAYQLSGEADIKAIYTYVRRLAKFFLYNPRVIGTMSFLISPIYTIARKHYKLKGKVKTAYFKNMVFDFDKIKKLVDLGQPVMLSVFRDGRNFYKNHTVIVIGYKTYIAGDKKLHFLIVNDNWAKEARYIDYQKLSILSSINYIK